jgi:hypothetical protein
MSMNLRHAAALALVGWYLMLPQVIHTANDNYAADYDSPLSKWAVNTPFDSASPCGATQSGTIMKGQRDMKKFRRNSLDWAIAQSLTQAQCISTDDPRLREK